MSRTARLGVFIVSTLAMLAVGSFLIGERQFLFTSTYPLKTTFRTVAGLTEGAEVRIGGIDKGVVKRIVLPGQPDGNMTVVMALDNSTRDIVRTDSVATIGTEGLLGSKFVEISFGSDDAPPVERDSTIPSEPAIDISDLVAKTSQILDTANDAMGGVQQSMAHLKDISAKIDQGTGTMGALVNDKKVYNQLNAATTAFQEDMEALKHNFFLRGFFNDRGYQDSTKLDDNLITRLPREASMKSFHYDVKKVFADEDHAKLKTRPPVREAGEFLEGTPFGLAVVVAASGLKGDSTELHTLLQARAMVVREFLVKNYRMDDTRVKTMEIGKTPETTTDAGTIDVLVYPTSVKPPARTPRRP